MILHSTIEQDTYNYTGGLSNADDYDRCDCCSGQLSDSYEDVDHEGETLQFCSESCMIDYAVQEGCIEQFFGTGATEEEVRDGLL